MEKKTNKKSVLSALLVMLVVTFSNGQNILTPNCNLIEAGDSIAMQVVEYVDAGGGGDSAVWDFGELNIQGVYYIKYDTLHQSQIAGYDAQNTLHFLLQDNRLYLSRNESALHNMDYIQPQLMQVFPFKYNDSAVEEYRGEGLYCGTHFERTYGTVQILADGQGTIILSENDTLPNTLRIHTINTTAIRLNTDSCRNDSDNLKQVITEYYFWYARGYRYPVFVTISSSSYDNLNHIATKQYALCCSPSFQVSINDSVNEEIRNNDMIARLSETNKKNDSQNSGRERAKCNFNYNVTTNDDHLTITYDVSENVNIHVMLVDVMGGVYRNIQQKSLSGSGYTINIDCSTLHRGQYILYINVNGTIYNSKFPVK